MWVGFFQEEITHSRTTLGAQVQWWYSFSMPQKCTACYLFHSPKKKGSRSEEVRWVSLSPPTLQNISISCLRNR